MSLIKLIMLSIVLSIPACKTTQDNQGSEVKAIEDAEIIVKRKDDDHLFNVRCMNGLRELATKQRLKDDDVCEHTEYSVCGSGSESSCQGLKTGSSCGGSNSKTICVPFEWRHDTPVCSCIDFEIGPRGDSDCEGEARDECDEGIDTGPPEELNLENGLCQTRTPYKKIVVIMTAADLLQEPTL